MGVKAEFDREVDRWGGQYAAGDRQRSWAIFRGHVSKRVRYRKKLCLTLLRPGEGEEIVDIGCDGGFYAPDIFHAGARWIGIDISFDMLSAGQERIGSEGSVINASALELPLKEAAADAVIAMGLINYFTLARTREFFLETYRVLRPGGRFIFTNVALDVITFLRSRLPGIFPRPIRLPGPIYPHLNGNIRSLLRECGLRLAGTRRVSKYGFYPYYTMFEAVKIKPVERR